MGVPRTYPSDGSFVPPVGNVLKEYNSSEDGTGRSYYPGERYLLSGIHQVYALWKTAYVVTFDPAGGSCGTSTAYTGWNDRFTFIPEATFSGHEFDGWYTEKTGGAKITDSFVFADNCTVYAHWTDSPSPASSDCGIGPIVIACVIIIALVAAGGAFLLIKKRDRRR